MGIAVDSVQSTKKSAYRSMNVIPWQKNIPFQFFNGLKPAKSQINPYFKPENNAYKLEKTVLNHINQVDYKVYINKNNERKYVYYFNNIPIKECLHGETKHSLIMDNIEEFMKKNVSEGYTNIFMETYGFSDFVHDLFINDKYDTNTKNRIFNNILSKVPDNTKNALVRFKNENIPDGDFEGKFGQDGALNCVIVGRTIAILSKPKGKQALKALFKSDGNGNSIITFKGLNMEVPVSYKEYCDKKYYYLSHGNADVKVLEIAWDKLTKYIGGVNNPLSNLTFDTALLGYSSQGIPNPMYLSPNPFSIDKDLLKRYYKDEFNSPDKAYAMGLNIFNFLFRIGVTLETEDGIKRSIQPAHQYAVVKADDKYVYIVNPTSSDEKLKLKWKDFNRLSFILTEIKL